MRFSEVMNKVRQWDNRINQMFIRHFYMLFFEVILVGICVGVFINALKIINLNTDLEKLQIASFTDRVLMAQSVNTLLIVILLLFNSFWVLYIFSSLLRLRTLLRNIDFNLSRRRGDHRSKEH